MPHTPKQTNSPRNPHITTTHQSPEYKQNRKTNTSVVSFLHLNSFPFALCCQLCSVPHGGTGLTATAPFVNWLSVTPLPSVISACPESSSKFEILPKYPSPRILLGTGHYHVPSQQQAVVLCSAFCALDSLRKVLAHQADTQTLGKTTQAWTCLGSQDFHAQQGDLRVFLQLFFTAS